MPSAYRFRVTGRVQGVGFRQSAQARARVLQLAGWVRNCADGSVEGLAHGEPEALAALHEWLRQGPPLARVDQLEWQPAAELPPAGFAVLR